MELWGFEGFIVGNTYIRVYVFGGILVRKVKVMLSLRDDVVRGLELGLRWRVGVLVILWRSFY